MSAVEGDTDPRAPALASAPRLLLVFYLYLHVLDDIYENTAFYGLFEGVSCILKNHLKFLSMKTVILKESGFSEL